MNIGIEEKKAETIAQMERLKIFRATINEGCEYLVDSSLELQIPAGFDKYRQYFFLKNTIPRTVSLEKNTYIAECEAYYFHDMRGDVYHVWPADTPLEQIVSELEQNGWKCSIETDGDATEIQCVYPGIDETIIELFYKIYNIPAQIEALDRSIDPDLPSVFDANSKPELPNAEFGFVRFGKVPPYGVSVNFSEGVPEKGVSCFPTEIAPNGNFQFTRMTSRLWESAMHFMDGNNRPLYRLYGDLVGYGSDGEPLLNVTKAEKITGNYIGMPLEDIKSEVWPQMLMATEAGQQLAYEILRGKG